MDYRTYFFIHLDGDAKTNVQNGFCVICFILTMLAAYLGYIYKRAL